MSNILEDQKYWEYKLFHLHKSYFQGKINKGRDRQIRECQDKLDQIKGILYPKKKRY